MGHLPVAWANTFLVIFVLCFIVPPRVLLWILGIWWFVYFTAETLFAQQVVDFIKRNKNKWWMWFILVYYGKGRKDIDKLSCK